METTELKITVPKASAALAGHIEKLIDVAGEALKDGFQPGQDLPPVVQALFAEIVPALGDLGKVLSETKEDGLGVAQALGNVGFNVARKLTAKGASDSQA